MANVRTSNRSGFRVVGGVRRRQTQWIGGAFANTTVSNSSVIVTSLNVAALALRPFTIVRSRGMLYINSDQTGATEAAFNAYGRAVVSDQASAIGVTAVPTPVTDNASDLWFLFQPLMLNYQFNSSIGTMIRGYQLDIDSKAMRKVEDGQDIVSVVENSSVGSGSIIGSFVRTLVKLH